MVFEATTHQTATDLLQVFASEETVEKVQAKISLPVWR